MNVLPRPNVVLAAVVAVGLGVPASADLLAPASAAPSTTSSLVTLSGSRHEGAEPSWFVDQLSPAERVAEIRVPRRPARFRGQPLRYTRALQRTRAGALAVPATLAYGHELLAGQALTFDAAALFRPHSARLTPQARLAVVRLAYSMAHVTRARCEGYMDYGRAPVRHTSWLSRARAGSLCRALAGQTGGLITSQVGYGSSRPAVVGAGAGMRAANRRVVLVVQANTAVEEVASPPTITGVETDDSGNDWVFAATWTTPDSDGGHAITGYEWSFDGGTTWTPLVYSTSGASNTGSITTDVNSCDSGGKTLTIRAVTSAGGGTASVSYDVGYSNDC